MILTEISLLKIRMNYISWKMKLFLTPKILSKIEIVAKN